MNGKYMIFEIPEEINYIISTLEQSGYEAWLAGGCVRDFCMGIKPKDYDICTSARPEQITPLFGKTINTGIKHGTITVRINNFSVEVTTFRVDAGYTDHRRPDFVIYTGLLTEDLKRRDFTINAMAYHPSRGLVDPYNGQKDLTGKVIRTVGDPNERFREDALRMLRAIRFKARFNFELEQETKKAIQLLAETIQFVSAERILSEINEILLSPRPEAFMSLFDLGLMPYIFKLPVPSMPDMKYFGKLNNKLSLRWAALLWQMGFDNKDVEKVCHDFKMSTLLTKEIKGILRILTNPLPVTEYNIRLLMSSANINMIHDSLNILQSYGAFPDRNNKMERIIGEITKNNHCVHISDLAVKGNDLLSLGLSPGKLIGDLMETLFLCVLQIPSLNRKDILLAFARHMLSRFPYEKQSS